MEEAAQNLCGEKFVSTSLVIPLIRCLQKDISNRQPDTDSEKLVKTTLLQEIAREDGIEKHLGLMIATLLDP